MALPVALFAMTASMGLAGAAVVSSVNVQRGTKHDSGAKGAIAVADGGANVAALRLARYANSLSSAQPCMSDTGGILVSSPATGPAGWCPSVSGNFGAGTYTYWVSPLGSAMCPGGYQMCIVSTGTENGVTRRILTTFDESSLGGGPSNEEDDDEEDGDGDGSFAGLVGQDGITVSGSADIRVGIGTNGDVIGGGNSHVVCGDIRVGVGKKNSARQCNGYEVDQGNVDLPPVSSFMPSNISTVNSNNRLRRCISTNNPTDCQKDTFTGKWSPTEPLDGRSITLSSKAITVGGGDYWLCSLKMSGKSELIMAAGAKVRFFFDTPEKCGIPSGGTQVELTGGSTIVSTGYQPSEGQFEVPGFYFLGSKTRTTWVDLGGNQGTNEFVMYGPDTNFLLRGSATYKGMIAGKWIDATGSALVENDAGFELPSELQPPPADEDDEDSEETPGDRLYTPQSYVECTGIAISVPSENC